MRGRFILAVLAIAAVPAAAADAPQWPPPPGVAERMRELQQVIIARDSTVAQRDAAREELANLLKSPAGQGKATPDEKPSPDQPKAAAESKAAHPARAAIDPHPPILMP